MMEFVVLHTNCFHLSYPSKKDENQYVSLDNKQITCKKVSCGVPQSSALGRLPA